MKFSLISSLTFSTGLAVVSLGCAIESTDPPDGSAATGGNASTATGGTTGMTGSGGGSPAATGGNGSTPGATGGAAPMPVACSPVDPNNLLSDFESGEAKIAEIGGRSGSWYMSDDGSGTTTPVKIPNTPLSAEAGGACDSAFAFHTTGTDFTGWGALAAVDLAPKISDIKQPYDASGYSGVSFRAKSNGAVQVRVEIATADSMPEGGVCNPDAQSGDPDRCGDHFGVNVVLSADWTDVNIPFSQMTQKGWGLAAAGLDASTVYSVRLKVEGGAFDYWFDDVALTK